MQQPQGLALADLSAPLLSAHLKDLLACPRCGQGLDGLRCVACRVDFPVVDDVPWLFADPEATRTDWRNRWELALAELGERAEACKAALRRSESEAASKRLSHLEQGYRAQVGAVRELLKSLSFGKAADLSTYLALKTRLPTDVGLFSYEGNVFRDWCWGDTENRASLDAVLEVLGDNSADKVLVLGAGAGRLAYDLHCALTPARTIALDLNPYLTTVCRRVTRGDTLELTEFPRAPRSAAQSALARELKAPAPAPDGFELVLGDATRPPFRPASFDLIVTPWLVDVIGVPTDELLKRINPLLTTGGSWLLHGSLAFDGSDPLRQPDLPELEKLAESAGFETRVVHEQEVPYLDCPDSRHGRRESVVTLRAEKRAEAEALPRAQSLPDWLAKGREPVPQLPAFQTQAMTTRMHAFIMTLIDGRRSLKDMAAVFEEQQLMTRADAEVALRGFLLKMYDEAARRGPVA